VMAGMLDEHVDALNRPSRVTIALQRLLGAIDATRVPGWSAATVVQLHSGVVPLVRLIAPLDQACILAAADLPGVSKEQCLACVSGAMGWLLPGLSEQLPEDQDLTQQTCEVLCALSDVLCALLAAPPSGASSGGSHSGPATTLSWVFELDSTGKPLGSCCSNALSHLGFCWHAFAGRPANACPAWVDPSMNQKCVLRPCAWLVSCEKTASGGVFPLCVCSCSCSPTACHLTHCQANLCTCSMPLLHVHPPPMLLLLCDLSRGAP
jgi:hypothetical protein